MWILVGFVVSVAVNGISGRHLDVSEGNLQIIGGEEVDITQYPHQINLLLNGAQHCGGSIISDQYVLTAAHCAGGKNVQNYCIYLNPPDEYTVRAGSTYQNKGGALYNVLSITSHPNFNATTYMDYDVAVVKVSGSIKIDGVNTKTVQMARTGSALRPGDMVTVTGWGNTNGDGNPSDVLKAASLPVVDNDNCKRLWSGYTITDRMMCAGFTEPGPATCRGDSGGPLIDNNFVQYGVVSFGPTGCQGNPTVFASVANLRSWIQQAIGV